jgi:hypothetical protein
MGVRMRFRAKEPQVKDDAEAVGGGKGEVGK